MKLTTKIKTYMKSIQLKIKGCYSNFYSCRMLRFSESARAGGGGLLWYNQYISIALVNFRSSLSNMLTTFSRALTSRTPPSD